MIQSALVKKKKKKKFTIKKKSYSYACCRLRVGEIMHVVGNLNHKNSICSQSKIKKKFRKFKIVSVFLWNFDWHYFL